MSERLAYTVREFAELVGLSEDAIYDGCSAGRIPHVRPTPGRILIPRHAAERWLEGGGLTGEQGSDVSSAAMRH